MTKILGRNLKNFKTILEKSTFNPGFMLRKSAKQICKIDRVFKNHFFIKIDTINKQGTDTVTNYYLPQGVPWSTAGTAERPCCRADRAG